VTLLVRALNSGWNPSTCGNKMEKFVLPLNALNTHAFEKVAILMP